MNYKKCNFIGTISFILILLFMFNLNFILENLNRVILNKKVIGIKGDEFLLSEFNYDYLTKQELADYLIYNLQETNYINSGKYDFAVFTRNIEYEDKFVETFRIDLNENFEEELFNNLDKIPKNEQLFHRYAIYFEQKIYMSKIFSFKIVDELYKDEKKMVLELEKFSKEGIISYLDIPNYINFNNNTSFNISAKHNDLEVAGLSAKYDYETKKIKLENIVPIKLYSYIEFSAKDSDGIDVIMNIKNFSTQPQTELQDYLSRIYKNTINRYPYENEYIENLNKLSGQEITITQFLTEFISSQEFNDVNDTPKKLVDSIYYLVKKQTIDSRLSALTLEEFNSDLIDDEKKSDAKLSILNKFLNTQDSLDYMVNNLNVKV